MTEKLCMAHERKSIWIIPYKLINIALTQTSKVQKTPVKTYFVLRDRIPKRYQSEKLVEDV